MREVVKITFNVLIYLSIDYNHFSKYVFAFIDCASSLIEIEKSIEKYGSPEEHI